MYGALKNKIHKITLQPQSNKMYILPLQISSADQSINQSINQFISRRSIEARAIQCGYTESKRNVLRRIVNVLTDWAVRQIVINKTNQADNAFHTHKSAALGKPITTLQSPKIWLVWFTPVEWVALRIPLIIIIIIISTWAQRPLVSNALFTTCLHSSRSWAILLRVCTSMLHQSLTSSSHSLLGLPRNGR